MANISTIQNKCYGCRSCEQICPQNSICMKPSKEGFIYPVVDENTCIHCGLCLKACPVKQVKMHRNQPYSLYAFKNKNHEEIMRSASGGAADVAASVVLRQNGVVYGAAYDDNFVVKHIEVTDNSAKERLQSSKYVQSDINDCYSKAKAMLNDGRKVLFIGTPCQIAGLYAFLGREDKNLYTMDLICHGVPSPKFFEKYLIYQRSEMKGNIMYYNFRSKDKRGWGTQYLIKTKTKTKTKTLSLDRYGKHFMNGDCYRESCYQCPYANMDRVGDITIGDFWGIAKSHPEFNSSKGVSSVFINSEKGMCLFEQMKCYAEIEEATLEEGMVKQHNLVRPSDRPIARDFFYNNIDEPGFITDLKVGLQLKARLKSLLPNKLIQKLKSL